MTERWERAAAVETLERAGRLVLRLRGRQIALFHTPDGVFACNNRCPHEGYPLSEGHVDRACMLTCQWHNWKFDLRSGDNRRGGDRLRVYPVAVHDGGVWLDLSDPPFEVRYGQILEQLREAFDDEDYARMARELARLQRLGADPVDAVSDAISRSHERLEFGWTHAYAGAADWLRLHGERAHDQETRLVCLLESVGHMSHDVLREPRFPYAAERTPYDEDTFVRAIDEEDEARAVSMLRGALHGGVGFDDVERGLTRAALAHYSDFGHSLIYVAKAGSLIQCLGGRVAEPLLVALARSLVYATREDEIPEFRGYAAALGKWGMRPGEAAPDPGAWRALGIDAALERTLQSADAEPGRLYAALLAVNAENMLHFDIGRQQKVRIPVSDNVGWLDFTHAITFANAVRRQCSRFPELWPQGLLQMACFSGRNARYTCSAVDRERWRVADIDAFIEDSVEGLFDHGHGEFIVSVHLLKSVLAVRDELAAGLPEETAEILAAALNRFLHAPLKRKHARRTAHQALQFVSRED